jgi:hypothetical protein
MTRENMIARYEAAVAQLRRSEQIEQGQSGAMVFAALAYGDTLEKNTVFASASHLAKLFCIAALFVIPNLLVIHVLL